MPPYRTIPSNEEPENVAPLNEESQEPVPLDYYGKPTEQYGDE